MIEVQGTWQHGPALYALAKLALIPGINCRQRKYIIIMNIA